MKGPNKEMKRTTITVAILALVCLTISARPSWAHGITAQGLNEANYQQSFSEPQSKGDQLTEELHQSYPLSATGRASIEDINGGVRLFVFYQNEVNVDVVKIAYQRGRL